MAQRSEISRDNFEQLLTWLDTDREKAGERYESIRTRLIKIFCARGCSCAEELADETIDRVARKADALTRTYNGEPSLFFYGVAKKVFLEFTRKPKAVELPARLEAKTIGDQQSEEFQLCLDECLRTLEPDQHKLIVSYYEGEKQAKIDNRKKLTHQLGVSTATLRVRVLRIRLNLQKCVLGCLDGRCA